MFSQADAAVSGRNFIFIMIYTSKLKTDQRNKEILPGNFEENMVVCMQSFMNKYSQRHIPWHCHDAFEIDYVIQGELDLHTADGTHILRQGDIVFINSGVMHEWLGSDECNVVAILFDMHFLSGIYNSQIERKYILPIKESSMEFYSFSPDSERRLGMARTFLNAIDIMKTEPEGYEMLLCAELSRFWIDLLAEAQEHISAEKINTADKDRIKKMLRYIHTAYAEKLTMEMIASAADISVRECTRCFSRSIGMPPNKYLNEYRLHVAAEMLLETDSSVLEISESCGFSSASYFGKTFLETMGCTPREYRISGGMARKAEK